MIRTNLRKFSVIKHGMTTCLQKDYKDIVYNHIYGGLPKAITKQVASNVDAETNNDNTINHEPNTLVSNSKNTDTMSVDSDVLDHNTAHKPTTVDDDDVDAENDSLFGDENNSYAIGVNDGFVWNNAVTIKKVKSQGIVFICIYHLLY